MMKNIFFVAFLLILSSGCFDVPMCELPSENCHVYSESDFDVCIQFEEIIEEVSSDLENYVHPFNSSSPSEPTAELDALKTFIGESKVIGLGEATHGTLEFFEMKDRVFRFMVEQMDTKAIGFEATWGGALHVNRYIQTGEGDVEEVIRKMKFWTWATEEVKALVEWMKDYNDGKPESERIYFYGFDMQTMDDERDWIFNYLAPISSEITKSIVDPIDELMTFFTANEYTNTADAIQDSLRNSIVEARTLFEAQEDELVQNSTQREYDLMHYAFEVILQHESHKRLNTSDSRDFHMAANVDWMRDWLENERIALWAHNGHLTKEGSFFSMGKHMAIDYEEDYKSIGFGFANGSFQAVAADYPQGLKDHNILEARCSSANAVLGGVENDNYYLIFNDLEENSPSFDYFNDAQRWLQIGSLYSEGFLDIYYRSENLPISFDAIIFFKTTTAAKAI